MNSPVPASGLMICWEASESSGYSPMAMTYYTEKIQSKIIKGKKNERGIIGRKPVQTARSPLPGESQGPFNFSSIKL